MIALRIKVERGHAGQSSLSLHRFTLPLSGLEYRVTCKARGREGRGAERTRGLNRVNSVNTISAAVGGGGFDVRAGGVACIARENGASPSVVVIRCSGASSGAVEKFDMFSCRDLSMMSLSATPGG